MVIVCFCYAFCRFANGTQGRLLHWAPGATENKRRALPAYCRGLSVFEHARRCELFLSFGSCVLRGPELLARFCKESSLTKNTLLPDVDFMDIGVRQETLTSVRGEPVMLRPGPMETRAFIFRKNVF